MTNHTTSDRSPRSVSVRPMIWRIPILAFLAALAFGPAALGQTGACCFDTSCTIRTLEACFSQGGDFFDGPCNPNPCAPATGTCCTGSTCTIRSPAQCTSVSGTFIGGTSCSPNPCTGSCCNSGNCAITSFSACASGVWVRNGPCSPNPCAGPCCLSDGGCTVTRQSTCSGTWTPGGGGACSPNPCPVPACDLAISGRFGGLTTGVSLVIGNGLLVARGTTLEVLTLVNTQAPASFSPPRRISLSAPAVKISSSPGSSRAFVLLENGDITYVTILTSPMLQITDPMTIGLSDTMDIVADGDRVYSAMRVGEGTHLQTSVRIHERGASGQPVFIRSFSPFANNFGIDRLAKIGNILWLGISEDNSNLFGVEGWNVSNPAAPSRTTTSLNFAQLGTRTELSAMHAIGNKLLITYENDDPDDGRVDLLRAADVTNPNAPVWHPPVQLNRFAECMSSTGNLLRIAIRGRGIDTWDTTNPASLLHRIFGLPLPHAGSSIATSSNGSSVLVNADAAGIYQFVMPQTWAPGFSSPTFSTIEVCLGGSINLGVSASASPPAITYQWFRLESQAIPLTDGPTPWGSTISGATTPNLTITGIRIPDARSYRCAAANSCGSTTSAFTSVDLCAADFNCSGAATVQDIFDFLAAYFAGQPLANFNGVGGLTVQDLFDFLAAYFAGCP